MGLNNLFRTHSALRSHGWTHVEGAEQLKEICERVFASELSDRRAFERGLRGVAGIAVDDTGADPATLADRDVFWSCIDALSRETGVAMFHGAPSCGRPSIRGH